MRTSCNNGDMRIDLHSHSTASDGTDSPAELVAAAERVGLDVLGVTDHDTFAGLDEAVRAGSRIGVIVQPGVEISTQRQGTSVHLLGYGCDSTDADLTAELAAIRDGRQQRIPRMVDKLVSLGMPLTVADVQACQGTSLSPGRPHVADAMIAAGYVANRQQAFDDWLAVGRPAYIPRYEVELERGIGLIRQAGGVAILAHPWSRQQRAVLAVDYIEYLVAHGGLDGIEVDHQDHDAPMRAQLRDLAADLGILMTGSSDYHGRGKIGYDLGCNTTDPQVYQKLCALITARGARTPSNR